MSENVNVTIEIPNAVWSHIQEKVAKVACRGTCKISDMDGVVLFIIGEVTFALKDGMPCVFREEGERVVFIFNSKEKDKHFGLACAKCPESDELHKLLESKMIFEQPTEEEMKVEEKAKKSKIARLGNKMASVIAKGGKIGKEGIHKGTKKAHKGIEKLTEKAKNKIKPREKPMEVSEGTKNKAEKVKAASNVAVQVSNAMLKGAMEMANQISDSLKPALDQYLRKKGLKNDKPSGPKTAAAKEVGKQSVKAAIELYLAMKDASVALMGSMLDATAELIDHRYGVDAGDVAKSTTGAVKNTLEAAKNVGGVGVKAVSKKIAMDTAVKAIDDPEEKKQVTEAKGAAQVLATSEAAAPSAPEKDLAADTKAIHMTMD